ncbi:hypothetical protein J2S17_003599 [Cytobacillus purgationiresistens]|uniref:Uncharacterized protein n=1 Tax=Cytobacillus purgationiresistens TaxID=863449 RepID=A0ABU0AKC0_9BACI|nr:hypothetical protein [Cytobacillus purgationiresistens]
MVDFFVKKWIFFCYLQVLGRMSGEIPKVELYTLLDNFYVPLLFIVGPNTHLYFFGKNNRLETNGSVKQLLNNL